MPDRLPHKTFGPNELRWNELHDGESYWTSILWLHPDRDGVLWLETTGAIFYKRRPTPPSFSKIVYVQITRGVDDSEGHAVFRYVRVHIPTTYDWFERTGTPPRLVGLERVTHIELFKP